MKLIKVKVKPNSPETRIVSEKENEFIVEVKAKAEQNKANIELIKFLSKKFGQQVRIIGGKTGRKKIISVG